MPFQSNAWNEQNVITWVWTKITTKFDHLQSITQAKFKVLNLWWSFFLSFYSRYSSTKDIYTVYTFQTCIVIVYYVFDVVFTQLQKTNL